MDLILPKSDSVEASMVPISSQAGKAGRCSRKRWRLCCSRARLLLILGEGISCHSPGEVPVHRLTSHPPLSLLQEDKTFTSCAAAAGAATFVPGVPCMSAAGQAMLSWEGFRK